MKQIQNRTQRHRQTTVAGVIQSKVKTRETLRGLPFKPTPHAPPCGTADAHIGHLAQVRKVSEVQMCIILIG